MEEKRKSKRMVLEGNLIMKRLDSAAGEIIPVKINDISHSGIGFVCDKNLEISSVYDLEIILWTKEKINAIVSLVRKAETPGTYGTYTYGGTFVGLPETETCKIDIYELFNENEE